MKNKKIRVNKTPLEKKKNQGVLLVMKLADRRIVCVM
jgi:hypothetical protein